MLPAVTYLCPLCFVNQYMLPLYLLTYVNSVYMCMHLFVNKGGKKTHMKAILTSLLPTYCSHGTIRHSYKITGPLFVCSAPSL